MILVVLLKRIEKPNRALIFALLIIKSHYNLTSSAVKRMGSNLHMPPLDSREVSKIST